MAFRVNYQGWEDTIFSSCRCAIRLLGKGAVVWDYVVISPGVREVVFKLRSPRVMMARKKRRRVHPATILPMPFTGEFYFSGVVE
jgi:hypothetical protein